MKNKDLGSKKINNEQNRNEGFSGENLDNEYNSASEKLTPEIETDKDGNKKVVERARNSENTTNDPERNWNENESLSRGVTTEDLAKKTVENKDRNSDITANRYPNSDPDNHKNRGNIKTDED